MTLGQLFLLAGVVIFGFYVARLRNRFTDRLAYLILGLTGAVLIIRPEWSTQLAQAIGIGRGADLVFYVFIVFSLFFFVGTAAHRRRLERDLTAVVRTLAILDAKTGGKEPSLLARGSSTADTDDRSRPPRRPEIDPR